MCYSLVARAALADPLGERFGGEQGSSPSPRSSSIGDVARGVDLGLGMIRVGRFLSHTHTSSIFRWKNG